MRGALATHLSPREVEVLRLVAHGKMTKEIAPRLGVGYKTIDKHREACCRKLNAHSSAELVYRAFQVGVVTAAVRPLVPIRNGKVLGYAVPALETIEVR